MLKEIDQIITKIESKKELLEKEKEKQRKKEKEEKEKQKQLRPSYTRRTLPYQYSSNTNNNDKNQKNNETKYNPRKINYNDSIIRVTPLEYNGFFKYLSNHKKA